MHFAPAQGCVRRSGTRWIALLGVVILAVASPPLASAETPLLDWQAPRSCPTERELLERVATRLEGRTIAHRETTAEGNILLNDGRYQLSLRLASNGQHATRTLSARSCQALTDTAAWLIAVALAPSLAAQAEGARAGLTAGPRAESGVPERKQPTEPTSAQLLSAAEAPSRSVQAEVVTAPVEADVVTNRSAPVRPRQQLRTTKLQFVSVQRQRRWVDDETGEPSSRERKRSYYASLFGGVFSAGLPAPVSSLGVRLGSEFGRVALQLRGAHMMSRTRESGAVRVRFPMQELGAATCVAWGERVRGGPCATLSLMRTTGFIQGASEPARSVVYWGTAGISAYLSWLVQKPFELSLESGLGLPISARPRFVLDDFGQLERASSLSLYARIGAGVRYP